MFLSLVVMVVVGARCFSLDSVLSSLADIFGDWFQIAFSAIYVTLWKFEKNGKKCNSIRIWLERHSNEQLVGVWRG